MHVGGGIQKPLGMKYGALGWVGRSHQAGGSGSVPWGGGCLGDSHAEEGCLVVCVF